MIPVPTQVRRILKRYESRLGAAGHYEKLRKPGSAAELLSRALGQVAVAEECVHAADLRPGQRQWRWHLASRARLRRVRRLLPCAVARQTAARSRSQHRDVILESVLDLSAAAADGPLQRRAGESFADMFRRHGVCQNVFLPASRSADVVWEAAYDTQRVGWSSPPPRSWLGKTADFLRALNCLLPDLAERWPLDATRDRGDAVRLVTAAYLTGDFAALPAAADALEEAECADKDLLAHLRSPGPHFNGCWACELVLDRYEDPQPDWRGARAEVLQNFPRACVATARLLGRHLVYRIVDPDASFAPAHRSGNHATAEAAWVDAQARLRRY